MTTDIQLKTGKAILPDDVKEQMRKYFMGRKAALESGEEFPVDLDDVWPFAFARKDTAVRALKRFFQEWKDYTVHHNLGAIDGYGTRGHPRIIYKLAIRTLDRLICIKNQTIHDIFLDVFNAAMDHVQSQVAVAENKGDDIENAWLVRMAKDHVRHEREIALLRDAQIQQQSDTIAALQAALAAHQTALEAKQSAQQLSEDIKSTTNYCTVVGYARRNGIRMDEVTANRHSHILGALCRQSGTFIGTVPHEKWGTANTYPIEMLDNHFKGRSK